MESQHSAGVPTCHDFPRFVIISEKSTPELGNRWRKSPTFWGFLGKRPLMGKFSQMFSKAPAERTEARLFVQISWNLADRKSVKSRVIYWTKKQKFGWRSRCRFCAYRAQNLPGTAPNHRLGVPQISFKSVHSGGVIAERANIVQTRHKVFPILGELSASSPSKYYTYYVS